MATSHPQRRGLNKRSVSDAEHDRQAMELYDAGNNYKQIAAAQGCAVSTAYVRVWRGMDRIIAPAVEQFREHENARLNALEIELWAIVRARHPVVSNGKKFDDLDDDGPRIAAINSLLRVHERRAKLNGLDAPQLHDVKVSEDDGLESEFRRLVAELGARAHGSPRPVAALEQGDGGQAAGVDSQ